MFFILSKIVGFLIQPLNVLFILMTFVAGLRFAKARSPRKSQSRMAKLHRAAQIALGLWIANLIMPIIPYMAVQVLEHRFPIPEHEHLQHDNLDPEVIVILGGWQGAPSSMRGETTPPISRSGDRLITGLILANQYKDAKIAFPGGLKWRGDKRSESDITNAVINGLELDEERLIVEGLSRNTAENAAFLKQQIESIDGQIILVTSAWHMPRAIGSFRAAGLDPIAYPTDFTTAEDGVSLKRLLGKGLGYTATALQEYIGLAAYRITGRTDELLPKAQ